MGERIFKPNPDHSFLGILSQCDDKSILEVTIHRDLIENGHQPVQREAELEYIHKPYGLVQAYSINEYHLYVHSIMEDENISFPDDQMGDYISMKFGDVASYDEKDIYLIYHFDFSRVLQSNQTAFLHVRPETTMLYVLRSGENDEDFRREQEHLQKHYSLNKLFGRID